MKYFQIIMLIFMTISGFGVWSDEAKKTYLIQFIAAGVLFLAAWSIQQLF